MIQKKLLNNNNNKNNKNNQQMNIFILPFLLLTLYVIGNNIFYLSEAYADLPEEINKIQDCKNAKIIDKALSNSNSKENNNNKNNQDDTQSIENFHHIKKFDSNGKIMSRWGIKGTGDGEFLNTHGIGYESKGTKTGQFMKPWGIGVDSLGNVYVGDQETPVVQKFDNNGNFIKKWGSYGSKNGQFVHIHDITLDSKDNVY